MADYQALCDALASNLADIPGLQESSVMLSNPTPPAAEVTIGPTKYDLAFGRGLDEIQLIVRVFVGFTSDIGAFKRIREFMASSGEMSIKAAIESDRQLGDLAQDLRVTDCSGEKGFLREIVSNAGRGSSQGPLIGAEWTVQVFVEGE